MNNPIWFPNDTPDECMNYVKELERGLTESVKLQSHYANLLNTYDGGQRMIFDTNWDWLYRLRETLGEIKS